MVSAPVSAFVAAVPSAGQARPRPSSGAARHQIAARPTRVPAGFAPCLASLKRFKVASIQSAGNKRGSRHVRCAVENSEAAGSKMASPKSWSAATVVENRAESADGTVRTLVLSVEDAVEFMDGRKLKHFQTTARWIDKYQMPGQRVTVRFPDAENQQRTFALASSPYASHSASANLAAGIVEVLVEHGASALDEKIANLAPGSLLQVSSINGVGFGSLFNSEMNLQRSLEEGRNILMIAQGTDGIAPLRSCIEWTPVQAHATEHKVTLVYLCKDAGSAAYLKDWDAWREAGVTVRPVYCSDKENNGYKITSEEALDKLAFTIYNDENGLAGTIGGSARDCTVLIAGLPGDVASALTRRLTADGVPRDSIWF